MSLSYFLYIILFVADMLFIFMLSIVMLHPSTKPLFRAPVPHIHDTIGKLA